MLKGVSGSAEPGETLFIMGPSGCGKTSLLNQMSDRIRARSSTKLSGEFLINGHTALTR